MVLSVTCNFLCMNGLVFIQGVAEGHEVVSTQNQPQDEHQRAQGGLQCEYDKSEGLTVIIYSESAARRLAFQ